MKFMQLEKVLKEKDLEINKLRDKLAEGNTINYNNCTFNIITTKDAIDTIHTKFNNFIEMARPFIKRHAKEEDIQQKLVNWGKNSSDPTIKTISIDIIQNTLPFNKLQLLEGKLENPKEVENGYIKEKELLMEKLNEIVEIEQLPEYYESDEYQDDEIDQLIKEADEFLSC